MALEASATINEASEKTERGLGVNLAAGHDISLGKDLGLGLKMYMHFNSLKHEFFSVTEPGDVTNFFWGAEMSLRFGK